MPEVLAALDAYVLTSLYEGTPFSLLEAMAMGLPIVANQAGGVIEVMSGNGYLVPVLQPEETGARARSSSPRSGARAPGSAGGAAGRRPALRRRAHDPRLRGRAARRLAAPSRRRRRGGRVVKVLSVIESLGHGGAESVLVDVALGLREHEHRVAHFSGANRIAAHDGFVATLARRASTVSTCTGARSASGPGGPR